MERYLIRNNLSKSWNFRKIIHKNIDYSSRFIKIFISNSEKLNDSLNSFGLRFTKFSIYFKSQQVKRKYKLKYLNPSSLVISRNILKNYKHLRKSKLFSLYKKLILIRINFEKYQSDITEKLNLNRKFNLKKSDIEKKMLKKNFTDQFNFPMYFKRKHCLHIQSIPRSDLCTFNQAKIYSGSDYYLKISKKFQKLYPKVALIFSDHEFYLFFYSKFSNQNVNQRFKIAKFFFGNVNYLICTNFFEKKLVYEDFFSMLLRSKKENKKVLFPYKNSENFLPQKKQKFRVYCELIKLVHFFMPKRVNFFFYMASFSLNLGWSLENINSGVIGKYFEKNFKKKSSYKSCSNPLSRFLFFFLKELSLILNFIFLSDKFRVHFIYLKDDLYKKMVSCNIRYELKEVHKVSYIHNYNKKSFCLDKYLQKKKKFWYRYSTKFFWYFFSRFNPLFSHSNLISEGLFRIIKKLNKIKDEPLEIKGNSNVPEFNLNYSDKKKNKSTIHYPIKQTFTDNVLGKSYRNQIVLFNSLKVIQPSNSRLFGINLFKFPGFLTLKEIQKKRKNSNQFIKNAKNMWIKKKKDIYSFNYLQYLKVTKNSTDLSKPFKKNVPNSENKREKTFEIELIERSGFIFFRKINLCLSLICLVKIVDFNKKKSVKYEKTLKNIHFEKNLKNLTNYIYKYNGDDLDFLFGKFFLNINRNLNSIKKFLKKNRKYPSIRKKMIFDFNRTKEIFNIKNINILIERYHSNKILNCFHIVDFYFKNIYFFYCAKIISSIKRNLLNNYM